MKKLFILCALVSSYAAAQVQATYPTPFPQVQTQPVPQSYNYQALQQMQQQQLLIQQQQQLMQQLQQNNRGNSSSIYNPYAR